MRDLFVSLQKTGLSSLLPFTVQFSQNLCWLSLTDSPGSSGALLSGRTCPRPAGVISFTCLYTKMTLVYASKAMSNVHNILSGPFMRLPYLAECSRTHMKPGKTGLMTHRSRLSFLSGLWPMVFCFSGAAYDC